MVEDESRRKFIGAAGSGIATALAGCSFNSETSKSPQEQSPENSPTDDPESNTTTEDSTNTSGSGDTIHKGEQRLEEYMSELNEGEPYPLGEENYLWIEFENPGEQLDTSLEWGPSSPNNPGGVLGSFLYDAERGEVPLPDSTTGEFDTFYMFFDDSDQEIGSAYLLEDSYNSDMSVKDNFGRIAGGYKAGSTGTLEDWTFEEVISEAVDDYSDVSDDFPQKYLDAIEG